MSDMNEIVVCKHCSHPEYYGEMRWLDGFCCCRSCYKKLYELKYKARYKWDDLDGKRPSIEEYNNQLKRGDYDVK